MRLEWINGRAGLLSGTASREQYIPHNQEDTGGASISPIRFLTVSN